MLALVSVGGEVAATAAAAADGSRRGGRPIGHTCEVGPLACTAATKQLGDAYCSTRWYPYPRRDCGTAEKRMRAHPTC
jgi:hypothetical protein